MPPDAPEIAALYRRYGFVLERRCARLLGGQGDARDAAQEAFVRALDRLRALQTEEERLGWLYRVATNLCFNLLRDARRRGAAWEEGVASAMAAPADPARAAEARQLLERLFSGGDDALTRELAVYVYVDGMSQGEAAALLGISRATANARLGRFRELALAHLGEAHG